jgi:hypothetical protein
MLKSVATVMIMVTMQVVATFPTIGKETTSLLANSITDADKGNHTVVCAEL